MDFSPNQKSEGVKRASGAVPVAGRSVTVKKSNKGLVTIVVAVVVVVLAVLGTWYFLGNQGTGAVKKDQYQAVFLTNGQVYFGKLADANGSYVKLTDVYYLQVNQTIQPKDGNKKDKSAESGLQNQNGNNDLKLIKLGNEIHGPDDQMEISNKQVLFWENLKKDGKVVKAIDSYKNKQ